MTARRPGLKLIVFTMVTAFTTVMLATVVGNMRFGPTHTYSAVFASASGISAGEDVKVAGVPVGKVTAVRLNSASDSLVEFTVDSDQAVYLDVEAAIRYKNLIGDHYLELRPGGGGELLAPGAVIGLERTSPATDLDTLVNGFRPLLRGLSPEQLNRTTTALVGVLNGQEEMIGSLFAEVGSLSTAVADRDEVIGTFITNLDQVLGALADRDTQFSEMIDHISAITGELKEDRGVVVSAIAEVDAAASATTDLLGRVRPDLKADFDTLTALAENLVSDQGTIDDALTKLPKFYRSVGRMSYGNFVNFYLCGLAIRYPDGSGHADTPMLVSPVERCN